MRGTVKWYNNTKGFGFIEAEGGGKDVFVHISQVTKSRINNLVEGQLVEFDKQETKKGYEAVNIRVV